MNTKGILAFITVPQYSSFLSCILLAPFLSCWVLAGVDFNGACQCLILPFRHHCPCLSLTMHVGSALSCWSVAVGSDPKEYTWVLPQGNYCIVIKNIDLLTNPTKKKTDHSSQQEDLWCELKNCSDRDRVTTNLYLVFTWSRHLQFPTEEEIWWSRILYHESHCQMIFSHRWNTHWG